MNGGAAVNELLKLSESDNDEEYGEDWKHIVEKFEEEMDFYVRDKIATNRYVSDQIHGEVEPIKRGYIGLNSELSTQGKQIEKQRKQIEEQKIQSENLHSTYESLDSQISNPDFKNNMEKINQSTQFYNEAKNMAQNTMNTSMTVLGIFVTIVVTIFGSVELMNSIGQIKYISFRMFIFYLLFIFTATLNIIYLLLHTLSRISGKDISVHCRKINLTNESEEKWKEAFQNFNETENNKLLYYQCYYCNNRKKCSMCKKLKRKYPYVFYPDVLLSGLMLFTFAANLMEKKIDINTIWEIIKKYICK